MIGVMENIGCIGPELQVSTSYATSSSFQGLAGNIRAEAGDSTGSERLKVGLNYDPMHWAVRAGRDAPWS